MSSHEEEHSLGDHPRMGTAVALLLSPHPASLASGAAAEVLGRGAAPGECGCLCCRQGRRELCSRKEPTSLDGKSPIVSGSEVLLKKRANPYFDFSSINNCWLITNEGFLQSPVVIRTTAASRQGSEALPASCGSHPWPGKGWRNSRDLGMAPALKQHSWKMSRCFSQVIFINC